MMLLCLCVAFFIQVLRNLSMYSRTFRCDGMRSVMQLDWEEGMLKTNTLSLQLLSAVFDAWKIPGFYGGLMLLSIPCFGSGTVYHLAVLLTCQRLLLCLSLWQNAYTLCSSVLTVHIHLLYVSCDS